MPSFNFPSLGLFSTLGKADTPSYADDEPSYTFDFPTTQPLMRLPSLPAQSQAPKRSILEELDDLAPKVPRPEPLQPAPTTAGTRKRKRTGLIGDTTDDEEQPDDLAGKIKAALQEPEDTLASLRSRIGQALGSEPEFDPFAPKPTPYTAPKPTGAPGAPSRAQLLAPKPQGPWKPGQELPGLTTRLNSLTQEFDALKAEHDKDAGVIGPAMKSHNKAVAAVNAEGDRITKDRETFDRHYKIWEDAGRPESLLPSLSKEEDELNARITAYKQQGEALKGKAPDLRIQNARIQRLNELKGAINRTIEEGRGLTERARAGATPDLDVGVEAVLDKWKYKGKPLNPGVLDTLKQTVKSLPAAYKESLKSGGLGKAAMDTIVEGVEALSGTAAAITSGIGESLPWATQLPGHQGEPDSFGGRMREHIINVLEGQGGKNMPLGVVGALMNPPDSAAPVSYSNYMNVEQSAKLHVRTPREIDALNKTRNVADGIARMVQDPVVVGSMIVPGMAGEVLATTFSAKGIEHAYEVAKDPKSTDLDIAEAFFNAALTSVPMAVRHGPAIREAVGGAVEAGVDVAGKAAYPVGKAMRESILALKLNLPTLARSFEASTKAGVHTPFAAVEMVQPLESVGAPQVGETVGDIYRTVRAPEPPELAENVPTSMNPNVVGGLRLRGFNDAEIAQMTPELAHYVFANDISKGPPVAPEPTPQPSPSPSLQERGMSGYAREGRLAKWTPPPPAPPTVASGPDAPAGTLERLSGEGMQPDLAQQFVQRAQQAADSGSAPVAVVAGQLGPQIVPAENVPQLAEGTRVLGVIDPHPHAPVRNAMVDAGMPAPQAQQFIGSAQEAANRSGAPMAIIKGQLGIQSVSQDAVSRLAGGTQVLGTVDPEPGFAKPPEAAPGRPASRPAVSWPIRVVRPQRPPRVTAFRMPDGEGGFNTLYHVQGGALDGAMVTAGTLRKNNIKVPRTLAPPPVMTPAPEPIPTAEAPTPTPAAAAPAPTVEAAPPAPTAAPTPTPPEAPTPAPTAPVPVTPAVEAPTFSANQPVTYKGQPASVVEVEALPNNRTRIKIQVEGEDVQRWVGPQLIESREAAPTTPAASIEPTAPTAPTAPAPTATQPTAPIEEAPKPTKVSKEDLAAAIKAGLDLEDEEEAVAAAPAEPTAPEAPAGEAPEKPKAEEPSEEKQEERRRRIATGSTALEDALSPKAQAGLEKIFKSYTRGRDLRHIREAMEIYGRLDDEEPTSRQVATLKKNLLAAMEAYFAEDGPAADVTEAAFAGLQHVTGEKDPDWNQLLENEVFATAHEAGDLIFNTLDPATASFDIEEFNTAFGDVEFRREGDEVFPEPEKTVNLWEGRTAKKGTLTERDKHILTHEEGQKKVEEWKAAAKAKNNPENARKVIISIYDRTGIISQPWADAGYSVRRFDIRPKEEGGTAEDLTDFHIWMGEIEDMIAEGYEITGILAQPPCTSFTNSGRSHWPKHDEPGYIDPKTGLTWLERTYGQKAAEHFDTPTEYAQTLVAVVKLIVAQANPRFYLMENPVGRIDELHGLPEPTLKFNPDDYGDPYLKNTKLWGEFNPDLPQARVYGEETEILKKRGIDAPGGEGSRTWHLSSSDTDEREQTSVGFAYAFFMGNEKLAQQAWENQERPPMGEPETGVKWTPYSEGGGILEGQPEAKENPEYQKNLRAAKDEFQRLDKALGHPRPTQAMREQDDEEDREADRLLTIEQVADAITTTPAGEQLYLGGDDLRFIERVNEDMRTMLAGRQAAAPRPAVSPPAAKKAGKPAPATAYSMNEGDIEHAVKQFEDHEVLGPAARFLEAFKDEVNAHSDGWPYWQSARKAASRLQTLLYGHLMAGMGAYPTLPEATADDVRATLPPIKSFMTKRGTKAGMTLPGLGLLEASLMSVEREPQGAASRPAVSQPTKKEAPRAAQTGEKPEGDQPKHPGDGGVGTPPEAGGGRRAVERPATPEPEAEEVEEAKDAPWADSEDYATYRYLLDRKNDARRWDPDEEYTLLEGALAALDEFPMLVRAMPTADLRDHLEGIEMLREETGKYALDELKSDLKGYDTSHEVVNKLEPLFDRELRRREGQQGLFDRPTADEVAARAKYADGRLIAQTGDHVYQEVTTTDGGRLFIRGEVYEDENQQQRVLITDSAIKGATEVGKTQRVSPHWLVAGDPALEGVTGEAAAAAPEMPAPVVLPAQPLKAGDRVVVDEGHGRIHLVSASGENAKIALDPKGHLSQWIPISRVKRETEPATPAVSQPAAPRQAKPKKAEAPVPAATTSWKAEITDGSGWASNALRFATKEEAQQSGQRTFDRWMAAKDLRVVESTDPVSHRFENGENVKIEAAPALSPEAQALADKKAKNLAAREEIKKRLRAELNKVSSGIDPTIVGIVAELIENYIEAGILEFRDAVRQFREDIAASPKADRAFEYGWAVKQHLKAGKSLPDAMALATKEKATRLKVADALKEADTTPEVQPDVTTDRPLAGGEKGESGTGRRGGGRAPRSGRRTGAGPRTGEGTQPGSGEGTGESGSLPGPDGDIGLTPQLYTITDADAIGEGSKRERVARNLAAIQVVKLLATEKRHATPEEQKILVQYVGWGGLSRIFEPWKNLDEEDEAMASDRQRAESQYWHAQHEALKALLTRDEYARARNSTQNAHYTSPTVVKAMWDAVQRLGIRRGSVLEPSSGIGHFVGLMPAALRNRMTWALVEKDALTAQIAQALYPSAYTQATGFEEATLPNNHFVLNIGNNPFGDIPITDKAFKGPSVVRRRIHNYFPAKALDKMAPGGLLAFITSHGSLDAIDDIGQKSREYLAGRADLIAAIRLPWTAFKGNAGTEVVTDIIFLRKRAEGEAPNHAAPWMQSAPMKGLKNKKGETFTHHVNEYFVAHPEMVLGTHTATGKMREPNQYNVEPTGDLAAQLQEAIARLPKNAINLKPKGQTLQAFKEALPAAGTRPFEFVLHEDRIGQVIDGKVTPVDLSDADEARIRAILPIRAAIRAVYDLLADPGSSDALVSAAQAKLEKLYDAFVDKFGLISEDKNWKAFREDPDFPLLVSLEEDYDAERGTVKKAAIFTTKTRLAEQAARSADTPAAALQLMLGELGRIDLERAGELLGVSADEAATQLAAEGLILDTPGGWELPAKYLSGNVRVKLAEAEAAAKLDPRYAPAVEALKSVIPPDIPSYKINTRLGAPWVPASIVTQFIAHIVNSTVENLSWTVTMNPYNAKWHIEGGPKEHVSTFATPDKNTKDLLLAALNDTRPVVKRDVPNADGHGTHKEINPEATALARARRDDLHRAFSEWLFNADPDRRDWAVRTYNDRMNAHVDPKVDGSYLTFPGMAQYWREHIRPQQRDGVARALLFGNTLAAWVVGAGKTLWMHALGMELRRLGLARKPLYVVPNHLIGQAPGEFLRHYPNAKLLVATPEDLQAENRKRFTARIAAGDWDGIIMPISTFALLSMSPEAEKAYHQEMLDEVELAILEEWAAQESEQSDRSGRRDTRTPPSVKNLENTRDKIKSKLEKLANRKKDDMLTFEQLGVDALIIDEAHKFKNLYFHTRQQAAGIPQNNYVHRAMDMYLKARYINQQSNYRNVFFATGTPVSNSMAEIFVMQKLLQEQTLEQAGLNSFDAWLQQFGHITIKPELDSRGTGISNRTRLANFRNLPDLGQMFRQVADIKMADDLPEIKAARPPLETGNPEVIAVPATERQLEYLKELNQRAENLDPRTRHIDNMAKVMGDGRMSALDQRLINREEKDDPASKINVMVNDAVDILNKFKKQNGVILVFMDMGTPGSEIPDETKEVWDPNVGERVRRPLTPEEKLRGFNLYEDFKKKLVKAKAVKPGEVAFIHDIKKLPPKKRDAALKTLFRKVRSGEIRVLMGSSETMATGMNVQDRLVALMNADPTMKPSDMEQRMGRILRQGNRFATPGFPEYDPNFKARILNYVTQGVGNAFGLDAVMWQLNESKATFIADFYKGRLEVRDAHMDLDNMVINAGLFKAVSTGNMLIMDQAEAAAEVDRLRLIHMGWEDQVREARWSRGSAAESLGFVEKEAAKLQALSEAATPKTETLTATIGGEELEGPKAIGEKLLETIQSSTRATEAHPGKLPTYFDPMQLGTMRGLSLWLVADKDTEGEPVVLIRHPDDPPTRYYGAKEGKFAQFKSFVFAPSLDKTAVGGKEWRNPQSIVQSLANGINGLHIYIADMEERARKYRDRVANYDKILASGFAEQAEYDKAVARLDDINRQLGIGDDQDVIEDEDEADSQTEEQAMAVDELSELFGEPPPPPRRRAGQPVSVSPTQPLPEAAGLTKERKRLNLRGMMASLRELLRPTATAEGTKGTIRHVGAVSFRELAKAHEMLKDHGKRVGRLTKEQAVAYWDAAERGQSTIPYGGDAEMDAGNQVLREVTEKFTEELVKLDRLKEESVRENYLGRFWSLEPEKVTDFVRRAMRRRPAEGPKSFLKRRTWDYFAEGIRAIQDAQDRLDNNYRYANDEARQADEQLAKMRPATYNWVESQLAKIAEMQRVIAIEHELRMEAQAGRAKKVMDGLGQKPPRDENGEPWVHLGPAGDPAFIVYGPKKIRVKEMWDEKLMSGLHNFARSLGVEHIRRIAVGGNRWGYAVGKSHIVTKVGGPEGILIHEIGHILDARYGLVQKWLHPARAKDKGTRATDRKIKRELRELADMREEGTDPRAISASRRRYIRKGSEKIANMVHAFIYMPERMKEVAPNAYWALHNLAKDTPELNQLLDIQKQGRSLKLAVNVAEQEIPGFPIVGHWYAPRDSANVWEAHLSTGIRGNPWLEAYLTVANGSVQILLGFSGFHFTTIAREAMNSRLALGIAEVTNEGKAPTLRGKIAKWRRMAPHVAKAFIAPLPITSSKLPGKLPELIDAAFGKRIMQEFRRPGTHPHLATVLDAMLKGGFRGTAESEFWTGQEVKRLKKTWETLLRAEAAKRGIALTKLPFDATFAGIELMMKPLMGYYVPYLKTAATYRAVARALQKLPPDTSLDTVHKVMGDIVKEMDFRYGQVVYENHFVDRMAKDLAQMVFLAPGWTFGTLALAGRGVKQTAQIPLRAAARAGGGKGPIPRAAQRLLGPQPLPDEIVGSSAAYWIGGLIFLAFLNGIITYFNTGEFPTGKDYLAYRDGTKDDDGNWNRHVLPGYEMKDIYGWLTHPGQTLLNKIKPLAAFMSRWFMNRTYFGDMVYNPDADALPKAWQVIKEFGRQTATPLSLQNYREGQRRGGGGWEVVRNFAGITPAKREFERTPAENKLAEYMARKGGTARTPEEVAEGDERRKLREAIRKGDYAEQQRIESSGQLSKRQESNAKKAATQTFLERNFPQLSIEQALTVYELATPEERVLIWSALSKKDRRLGQQGTPDERARIEERFRKAMELPQSATVH